MSHKPECRWERTTTAECEYRATHEYCPHSEHACDCPPVAHYFETLDEADRSFDLYHGAIMRGQKLWRDEKPDERALVGPDTGNLVKWLLDLVERAEDRERLLRFAGRALSECHIEFVGDWDGGSLQEAMLECGLLEQVERTVPCEENCACADAVRSGETTRCCVTTPLGDRAWGAYNDARKQIGRATRSGRESTEKA